MAAMRASHSIKCESSRNSSSTGFETRFSDTGFSLPPSSIDGTPQCALESISGGFPEADRRVIVRHRSGSFGEYNRHRGRSLLDHDHAVIVCDGARGTGEITDRQL